MCFFATSYELPIFLLHTSTASFMLHDFHAYVTKLSSLLMMS